LALLFIVIYFFRSPVRIVQPDENIVLSPADGKVVAVEKVFLDEFINEERIQVSIFMSPFNVHVNWIPLSGTIKYFMYHCGNYLVAWHPKSSCDNERTSTVIESKNGKTLMIRQIAGALARRIVTYTKIQESVIQGQELGFIKFGSRVDVFFPINSKINVSINQKVKGNITILGKLSS
ncbi:MAG: phosphatidylserine decarboxylase, partial [Bacteroidetes bacterium GWA2_30_7]